MVGTLAVVFDLVLEPVAIALNYWQWAAVSVPFQNYVAWFVIAAVVSTPLFLPGRRPMSRVPAYYVAIQFLFVASLIPLQSIQPG
jgi:putative membrane protein